MVAQNPYPERSGNAFTLLAGADAFIPEMELAIHRASSYVILEQYLFESGEVADRFINALVSCKQRGVRVYMLIDHFGAHGLSHADRHRILGAGINLIFYNPVYLSHFLRGLPRNHCKLLVVDGEVAFTGGVGISDDYVARGKKMPWQDVMVEMRGPIVEDWEKKFAYVWRRWNGEIDLSSKNIAVAGEQSGRLLPSFRGRRKFVRKTLIFQIRHASDRVWFGTAYFLPGRRMLRALRTAKMRGVDVRLLLPGPINDHSTVYHAGRRYYRALLRRGIRIFEYQPAFLHAKIHLCDGWCSVGSCNMDRWGLRWNLEANLESFDIALCADVENFFNDAFLHAREITLDTWRQRPLKYRVREWLFGYVDLIIERFGLQREIRKSTQSEESIFNPRP